MKVDDTYKFERDYLTDWDGTPMLDGEPRIIPSCKILREMIDLIRSLDNDVDSAYHQLYYQD